MNLQDMPFSSSWDLWPLFLVLLKHNAQGLLGILDSEMLSSGEVEFARWNVSTVLPNAHSSPGAAGSGGDATENIQKVPVQRCRQQRK